MIAEAAFCLALNVFYEARSEPPAAQLAVAFVTLRRAEQHNTTVCWQVFRDSQFSWTLSRDNLKSIPRGPAWRKAQMTAALALAGFPDSTQGADHYHRVDVKPAWAKRMKKVGRFGSHVFYRAT
jgi:spore germination cell wall hydrolase CwlJ-like protein